MAETAIVHDENEQPTLMGHLSCTLELQSVCNCPGKEKKTVNKIDRLIIDAQAPRLVNPHDNVAAHSPFLRLSAF